MSRPTIEFNPLTTASGSAIAVSLSKWATIILALTPVSVRPAPTIFVGHLSTFPNASSSVDWTLMALGCDCHPWKGAPR